MTTPLQMGISAWSSGIAHEIQFWDRWAKTKGHLWPEEFERRLNPEAVLDAKLGDLLQNSKFKAKILDVGAGPMTVLGKKYKDVNFEITACDPLSSVYDIVLARYNILPLVRTTFATAEDLSCFFPEESFDVVFCQNALDHSFDPARGIVEMIRVVKRGGCIVLRHGINEAEKEKYVGFHQFNFDLVDEKFCIWNRNRRIFLTDFLNVKFDERVSKIENSIHVYITKLSSNDNNNYVDLKNRIKEVVEGVILNFTEKETSAYYANSEL